MSDKNNKDIPEVVEIKEKKKLFAETSVSNNATNYAFSPVKYTAENVITLLEDPQKNASSLQEVSLWLYYNSGIYYRLINNFSGMNRYDMYLFPSTISKFAKGGKKKNTNADKLLKEYLDIAQSVEKISHKSNFRTIGTNLMITGEVFLYKIEDNSGVIIREIPSNICKISKVINDGLYKYSINMSKLGTEALYNMMPKGIQQLYDKHKASSIPPEGYSENNYAIVDDKEAVCLSMNQFIGTKSVPPMCFIFPSIIRLMEEEENEVVESKANNLKLIHMKYPIDNEGESLLDEEIIRKAHNSAKANLPQGVAINTNCLELSTHTLQRTSNVQASNRQTLTELVYNNAGVNSELFNGNNSNNQAILSGLVADEIIADTLNNLFENYIKYDIKSKKKNPLWLPRFIRNTKYNENTLEEQAYKGATVGLSRMKYLATQHYSPLEALSILEFETENGIDDLFVPLATAYTQSAEAEENNGRPKASDSDSGKEISDNQDSTK